MTTVQQLYTRLAYIDVEPMLDLVREHLGKKKGRVDIAGYSVGVVSLRMRTFQRDGHSGNMVLCCAACGLKASFFAVERQTHNKGNVSPHANLYGVRENGEEVLFTHDHILARALGGKDDLSNTQTMCYWCNQEKAIGERELVEAARNANLP